MPIISLVPHPAHPPHRDVAVRLKIELHDGCTYHLSYEVEGVSHLRVGERGSGRIDELWRHTCFEFFAKTRGESVYREFNFAPPAAWAVYDFDDWREGMRSPPLRTEPSVLDGRISGVKQRHGDYALYVALDRNLFPIGPLIAAPTAVLEARDGSKSYWAMAHPSGAPNFHHPACFALELSAPDAV